MSREINIWGLEGCDAPNGKRCTECCFFMFVLSLKKDRATTCRHEVPTGCGNYKKRPEECQVYHCSHSSGNIQWGLINSAENRGRVTQEEAAAARSRIIIP